MRMPSIDFSQEDFDFLAAQADAEGISIEEYLSNMTERQRLIVKYQGASPAEPVAPKSNLEPPHRKWGM